MPILVLDPPPAEFQALLERRRQTGADRRDEVWEGVLHMAPAPHGRHSQLQLQILELLRDPAATAGLVRLVEFNLGEPEDYRIPDGGLHRPTPDGLYLPTAAMAIEVLSPSDQTQDKLGFYAAHQVDELLIIDPDTRTIRWLGLDATGTYARIERSRVIDLDTEDLAARIKWPA